MSLPHIQSAPPAPSQEARALSWLALPEVTYRRATRRDAPAIANIYNEALPGCSLEGSGARVPCEAAHRPLALSRLHPIGEAQVLPWLALHETSGRPVWLAEIDGQTAGWLSLLGFSDRPGCACAAEIAVYVAKRWQGRGIGSGLLSVAQREAPALGLDRLMAFVWRDNARSLRLFDAHGFGIWGLLPGVLWVEGRSLSMVILGMELHGAPGALPA